ncbi:uncharacterized protein LOC117792520 [Drosophila innubila]|uniref:uncharacterized protein LOC117792520 n=1 Tax=Drosophila innubila TaxID=198719 RepID=UPI00148C2E8D|nr:uncharacterized protein LOC117792520 [Drosophila innubila]
METEAKIDSPASKVPNWVQAELFLDVLKESVKGFSKIKSFKTNSGSATGENYATIMLRVTIDVELEDGKEKSVSYMLKVPHQLEMFQKMENDIFTAERSMYKTVVPEMEQLYRDAGVEVKFGAQIYELKGATTEYILLEDLAPKGFKNSNRIEGLDQVHTESALRKLSQWHAASAVRVATKGAYPDHLIFGFYKEENRAMMVEVNKQLGQNFVKCCATYEGNEEYIEQVKALQLKFNDEVLKLVKVDPNEFNVLNHGDFWSNNMMYSHDSFGKIKEIYLVDFQLPKYGTVAQDLYYFLLSSTKFEDKLTKFDYYIKFYHENLTQHLKLLKYPKTIPTLRDIHLSLFKHGLWGYMTATSVMSGILLDPTEDASVDHFLSDSSESNDFKTLLYSNPRYRKHIQAVLPWLLNRGALEP